MRWRLVVGMGSSICVILLGGILFLVLSIIMTGSDLRNWKELLVFIGGVAFILLLTICGLFLIWRWVLN